MNRPGLCGHVAVACALACGGSPPAEVLIASGPEPDEDQPEVNRDLVTRELEATVLEIYSHLTLGNTAAYSDSLAGDQEVALFGVTPDDVVVGQRPRAAGRDRRLYRTMAPTVLAKNLEIHLSADASVGWTFDEMSYRVPVGGRTVSIPIRNTSVFVRSIDRWFLVMEHLSYATTIEEVRAAAPAGRSRHPARFPSLTGEPSARELVRLVGLLHNSEPRELGRRIAADGGTLVLLPGPEHELHGAAAASGPALAALFGPNTTVGLRDYRVGASESKTVAWMAANLVVRTVVNDEQVDIGMRGTYVFRRDARGWALVQMHVGVPLDERELSRHVFGD